MAFNPSNAVISTDLAAAIAQDDILSNRSIELDPGGYFLIYLSQDRQQICADHYSNTINDQGIACDPETGKPLPCSGSLQRSPTHRYAAPTAKQLSIAIFEAEPRKPASTSPASTSPASTSPASTSPERPCPVTRLDHAAYLGREFQKAEAALWSGQPYIQD